jgi:hypothetical protein
MSAPSEHRRRPHRATGARRLSRGARWLIQLARLLLVACVVQLSGSPHLVVDLLVGSSAGCIDTCAAPCGDDDDDHGCPPDCPGCSCPHGRLPSLPPSLIPVLPELLAWELPEPWTPYRSGLPPSPPLPRLDRPPRA